MNELYSQAFIACTSTERRTQERKQREEEDEVWDWPELTWVELILHMGEDGWGNIIDLLQVWCHY